EPERRPQGDLPGKAVVGSHLTDRDHDGVGERLPGRHRRDGPPQWQSARRDRKRAEQVHDRVQEEGEVDREEVPPADDAQLGRNGLDAVSLDAGHYAGVVASALAASRLRLCRITKSIPTRLCSSVFTKMV